jgi:hypothetical protein
MKDGLKGHSMKLRRRKNLKSYKVSQPEEWLRGLRLLQSVLFPFTPFNIAQIFRTQTSCRL